MLYELVSLLRTSHLIAIVGRDSSVGIATRYRLDGPAIDSRWGRHFPHPSRQVKSPTQFYYKRDNGSFPGIKQRWRGVSDPPPFAPRLMEGYSYISAPPLYLHGRYLGEV
jgi:hypothetical protein